MGELTVWLNTDASIRLLNKGSGRPIVKEEHRMQMIKAIIPSASVRCFGYASPVYLWERLPQSELPHLYIKEVGAESSDEAKFMYQHGIMCAFIPRIAGISTTEIIRKCQLAQPSSTGTEPSSTTGGLPELPPM
jgi:bifunctional ADP-heptose synthase (sugar kinase/adenylyltransferase)